MVPVFPLSSVFCTMGGYPPGRRLPWRKPSIPKLILPPLAGSLVTITVMLADWELVLIALNFGSDGIGSIPAFANGRAVARHVNCNSGNNIIAGRRILFIHWLVVNQYTATDGKLSTAIRNIGKTGVEIAVGGTSGAVCGVWTVESEEELSTVPQRVGYGT